MTVVGSVYHATDMRSPVPYAVPGASESITSSGNSQQSTNGFDSGEWVSITSSGGAVWVAVGASPTAAAGTHWLTPDGGTTSLRRKDASHKVAIIDA